MKNCRIINARLTNSVQGGASNGEGLRNLRQKTDRWLQYQPRTQQNKKTVVSQPSKGTVRSEWSDKENEGLYKLYQVRPGYKILAV